MGVTVFYRGSLADIGRVDDFEDRVLDLALEVGGQARVWRSFHDDDPRRIVRGVMLDLYPGQETWTLREKLLSDPGLLDEAVWRLFEVAGSMGFSLTTHDCREPPRRPEYSDQILALLRLAPDRRAEALRRAADVTDEFGQALRYALGESRFHLGPNTALWVAAARARCPYGDDPLLEVRHGLLGPDAATAAKYSWRVERVTRTYAGHAVYHHCFCSETQPLVPEGLGPNLVTVQFHGSPNHGGPVGGPSADTVRWVATVWPIARESFFEGGVEAMLGWPAEANRTYPEFLLDPDTPLGPMALVLLVLGLGTNLPDDMAVRTPETEQIVLFAGQGAFGLHQQPQHGLVAVHATAGNPKRQRGDAATGAFFADVLGYNGYVYFFRSPTQ